MSIISSLLKNCTGANKQRVINKFTENDFEKIDRLLELYFKYSEEVEKIEKSIEDDDEVCKNSHSYCFILRNLTQYCRMKSSIQMAAMY